VVCGSDEAIDGAYGDAPSLLDVIYDVDAAVGFELNAIGFTLTCMSHQGVNIK